MIKRLLVILLLSALVTGCGFKLRGNVDFSATPLFVSIVHENYVAEDYQDIIYLLKRRLKQAGAILIDGQQTTDDQDSNSMRFIDLNAASYEKTVRTRNAQGLATGYDLVYEIAYQILASDKEVLRPSTQIVQRRTLEYPAGKELEGEEQETFLKKEMEESIVSQIIRSLQLTQ